MTRWAGESAVLELRRNIVWGAIYARCGSLEKSLAFGRARPGLQVPHTDVELDALLADLDEWMRGSDQ